MAEIIKVNDWKRIQRETFTVEVPPEGKDQTVFRLHFANDGRDPEKTDEVCEITPGYKARYKVDHGQPIFTTYTRVGDLFMPQRQELQVHDILTMGAEEPYDITVKKGTGAAAITVFLSEPYKEEMFRFIPKPRI